MMNEPVRDLGSHAYHSHPSDADLIDHRSQGPQNAVFIGVQLPKTTSRRRRHHHRHHGSSATNKSTQPGAEEVMDPSHRIRFLLGDEDEDEEHQTHELFCQLDELHISGDDMEWKETARWIKFEEDVEEGGERWSKPHVATLSLHSLLELRCFLLGGTVLLDMTATTVQQAVDMILDSMVASKQLEEENRDAVRDVLLARHHHQHEKRHKENGASSKMNLPIIRSLADIGKKYSEPRSLNVRGNESITSKSTPNFHSLVRSASSGAKLDMAVSDMDRQPLAPMAPTIPEVPSSHREEEYKVDTRNFLEKEGLLLENIELEPLLEKQRGVENAREREDAIKEALHDLNTDHIMLTTSHSAPTPPSIDPPPPHEEIHPHKINQHFMKKIPAGAEASNILVGEVPFLTHPITAFVRLSKAVLLGDMTEVPVPSRFVFILLGPITNSPKYHEIGRSIATLMSDEIFHDVAYHAKSRQDLLDGIDEFLDQVTVLPPGEWDPTIRIEPPKSVPSQSGRKATPLAEGGKVCGVDEEDHGSDPSLTRTGRLFGGLRDDIKRKIPFYISDFRDSLSIQCLASFIYLYFACLTPIITFGGLLGDATGLQMAAFESLLAGSICGIIYALFSGQPLTVLGSTGPVLIFETIVYTFCKERGFDFLGFRVWIGIWTGLALIIVVMFDLSALVRFITRFTEESFSALISLIFIYEAIFKLLKINKVDTVHVQTHIPIDMTCDCVRNDSAVISNTSIVALSYESNTSLVNYSLVPLDNCTDYAGSLVGVGCDPKKYVPDVFLFCILIFLGTFTLAVTLKLIRNTRYFRNVVRQLLSDFSVVIAIVIMVMIDALVGLPTPKLNVPSDFKPTKPGRSWFISPIGLNPWYMALAAILPSALATILIFMDQQITAVIVNRKENKLLKSHGYHLDLLIVAVLIIVCSLLGLPWFVAATVLSITHVMSLKKESKCTAPGESAKFLGVQEQRVTGISIFLFIGLSVLFTGVLKHIPMAVLYGVFLYMGVMSLRGVQLVDRFMILFMPLKYQPDLMYLRHVRTKKVYIFTLIQVTCLAILWTIKMVKQIAITFPLMVLAMCFIRKGLDRVFTQDELKWLDDIMPESHKRAKEDEQKQDEEVDDHPYEMQSMQVNLAIQSGVKPEKPVNITEEMAKTGMWKTILANDSTNNVNILDEKTPQNATKKPESKHRHRHKKSKQSKELPAIPDNDSDEDKNAKNKKKTPVTFFIEEEETDNLMSGDAPKIVIECPSGATTPDSGDKKALV